MAAEEEAKKAEERQRMMDAVMLGQQSGLRLVGRKGEVPDLAGAASAPPPIIEPTALQAMANIPPAPTGAPSRIGSQTGLGIADAGRKMAPPLGASPISSVLQSRQVQALTQKAPEAPVFTPERREIGGMVFETKPTEEQQYAIGQQRKAKEQQEYIKKLVESGALNPAQARMLGLLEKSEGSAYLSKILTPEKQITPWGKEGFATEQDYLDFKGKESRATRNPTAEGKPRFGEIASLRKEFNTEARPYKTINDALKNIEALGTKANPTPQDLQALVYQFVKVQDPTSVVRESEYANAANAAALTDKMSNYAKRVLDGQSLTPKQRADMVQTARALRAEAMGQYGKLADSYEELAGSFGMSPKTIVPNRLDASAGRTQGASTPAGVDAAKYKSDPAYRAWVDRGGR